MADFASVKHKYLTFGVQLGLPMAEIQGFEKEHGSDPSRILHRIFDYWLCNTPEETWFEKLHHALEFVGNQDLATVVEKNYIKKLPLQGIYCKHN